jgi:hypothetical protein
MRLLYERLAATLQVLLEEMQIVLHQPGQPGRRTITAARPS